MTADSIPPYTPSWAVRVVPGGVPDLNAIDAPVPVVRTNTEACNRGLDLTSVSHVVVQ